jgi:hypothetical protein
MFHGTYDRADRADRYRKVAAEYTGLSEATPDQFLRSYYLRIAEDYQTSPFSKCGNWSESRSPRWPPAQTCQARRHSPTTPASRYFNAELLQVAHRISCLAPGLNSTITKPLDNPSTRRRGSIWPP